MYALHCDGDMYTLQCDGDMSTLHCDGDMYALHCDGDMYALHCDRDIYALHWYGDMYPLHCDGDIFLYITCSVLLWNLPVKNQIRTSNIHNKLKLLNYIFSIVDTGSTLSLIPIYK